MWLHHREILLPVLLGVCFSYGATQNELRATKQLFHDTLKTLKRTLDFFSREYKNVNLDGIIGTRLVDGTLKTLLHHIDYDLESWPLDGATIQTIRDLQAIAEDVSDNAIPYIEATDPVYYRRIGQLIQKDFWLLDFASKDFKKEDIYNAWLPKKGEAMREEESDNCLTELFGTGDNTKAKCQISSECWEKMTRLGYSGYSLTHQVFYLQIAYKMGCAEEMNKQRTLLRQPPPSELVDRFCAAAYLEAKDIERHGFPQLRQDLFMEQAVLCGVMGFRWFFSPEWLEKIISWQDRDTGCYKGETISESQVEFRSDQTMESKAHRVKREERILSDGCLSHRSTLAASALALYVRYIAEFEQMIFERNQLFS